MSSVLRFAYADPPYLGLSKRYYSEHPEAAVYDTLDGHRALVARLNAEYDGWAMSLHSPSLKHILPLCPDDCRIMAWVKPFASFKPGVNPAYCWEPVIVRGGRRRGRDVETVRDWVSCSITLKRGLVGAKPEGFCRWLFTVLGAEPTDLFCDLFPGTGAVGAAWDRWCAEMSLFEGVA